MMERFRDEETDTVEEPRSFDDFDLRLGDVMRGERATMGKSLLDVQRELKIKATYIAAIENADPSAFETPGFIAGYVRSYSRYLDLDPDWAFRAFCAESGFQVAHGMSQAATGKRAEPGRERSGRDPLGGAPLGFVPRGDGMLSRIEPRAIGSLLVLLGLIGAIGYGGYAVLNEVQKVQFVPIGETPDVTADLDPLASVRPAPSSDESGTGDEVATATNYDRIYRPEALDVPVLEARDGPISAIDPRRGGPDVASGKASTDMASVGKAGFAATSGQPGGVADGDVAATIVQVVEEAASEVVLMAVRPSWVRVRAADGTVIYERIMEEGDRFVLPQTEEPATLRTGESGAIYFALDGAPYGPAGRPGAVTSDLALDAETLSEAYQPADPEADAALAAMVAELQEQPVLVPAAAIEEQLGSAASE